jgi:hypothetical protein
MGFMHRHVCQLELAHHVPNSKNVWHVGAHLEINVDETTAGHCHTGLVGRDFLVVGRAAQINGPIA